MGRNLSKIRALVNDKSYVLANPFLLKADEYTYVLYLKMLCTIEQYKNEPTNLQEAFLSKLIKCISPKEASGKYMLMALGISARDIDAFFELTKEDSFRLYFALDSLLLVAMGNPTQENTAYLAEILELSGITAAEMSFLSLLVQSIIQQDSKKYEEANDIMPETYQVLDLQPYIKNYVSITTKKTPGTNKEIKKELILQEKYTLENEAFSNLCLDIKSNLVFEGCKKVSFKNCDIHGKSDPIILSNCDSVRFEGCTFSGFMTYTIIKKCVKKLVFSNCRFENCYYVYRRKLEEWKDLGGVIHFDEGIQHSSDELPVKIEKCSFLNCGGKNYEDCCSSAVISNDNCEIVRCTFENCWNYCRLTIIDREFNKRALFPADSRESDNKVINSCKIKSDRLTKEEAQLHDALDLVAKVMQNKKLFGR